MKQKLVIFASGTPDGGGTGAVNLVQNLPHSVLAIVSNHEDGGVKRKALALGVPFVYFPGPYTADGYRALIEKICEERNVNESDLWYALSGWFKKIFWLSPVRTFNIHGAPLPRFAGKYGEKLHLAVWDAYQKGEIVEGEVFMQFVNYASSTYDDGPIFFRYPFSLLNIESYEEYREYVRDIEHYFQPILTNRVMEGKILWDGIDPKTLIC